MVPSLGQKLYPHPGVFSPTNDALYSLFGRFLDGQLPRLRDCRRLLDVGCGTGVLALLAGKRLPGLSLTLLDC